jgi:hypothetical protein
MNLIKLLALVTVVTALMAAMATSASASAKICSTAGTGEACQAGHGKVYTGAISGSLSVGSNAVFTASVTITCKKSTTSGSISSGVSGTGSITSLTFSECSSGIFGACTFTTTASAANPYPATATTDGTSTSTNGWLDLSKVTLSFTCAGSTCKWEKGSSNNEITIDGSDTTTAKLTLSMSTTLEPNQPGFCGAADSNMTWEATYTIATPDTVIVE